MQVSWTEKAVSDTERLYQFLSLINKNAALAIVSGFEQAAALLGDNPRMGHSLSAFLPQEVRELIMGDYVIRYQIKREHVYILRL